MPNLFRREEPMATSEVARRHTPSTVAGTTSLPYSITSQCTGRTNSALPAPQRMRLGMGSASSDACTIPAAAQPRRVPRLRAD